MRRYLFLTICLSGLWVSPLLASSNEPSWTSYEEALTALEWSPEIPERSALEDLQVYGGVSFVSSLQSLQLPQHSPTGFLHGVEAFFGLNLFVSNLLVEGGMRSLTDGAFARYQVSLKEFFLLLAFRTGQLMDRIHWRLGYGISARYLSIHTNDLSYKSQNPASLFSLGWKLMWSPHISLGFQTSYRIPMGPPSYDSSSADFGLLIQGQF